MKNYYAILGITPECTADEIKKAYDLSRQWYLHTSEKAQSVEKSEPESEALEYRGYFDLSLIEEDESESESELEDITFEAKAKAESEAEIKLKLEEVEEAYAILSNPEKKAHYDRIFFDYFSLAGLRKRLALITKEKQSWWRLREEGGRLKAPPYFSLNEKQALSAKSLEEEHNRFGWERWLEHLKARIFSQCIDSSDKSDLLNGLFSAAGEDFVLKFFYSHILCFLPAYRFLTQEIFDRLSKTEKNQLLEEVWITASDLERKEWRSFSWQFPAELGRLLAGELLESIVLVDDKSAEYFSCCFNLRIDKEVWQECLQHILPKPVLGISLHPDMKEKAVVMIPREHEHTVLAYLPPDKRYAVQELIPDGSFPLSHRINRLQQLFKKPARVVLYTEGVFCYVISQITARELAIYRPLLSKLGVEVRESKTTLFEYQLMCTDIALLELEEAIENSEKIQEKINVAYKRFGLSMFAPLEERELIVLAKLLHIDTAKMSDEQLFQELSAANLVCGFFNELLESEDWCEIKRNFDDALKQVEQEVKQERFEKKIQAILSFMEMLKRSHFDGYIPLKQCSDDECFFERRLYGWQRWRRSVAFELTDYFSTQVEARATFIAGLKNEPEEEERDRLLHGWVQIYQEKLKKLYGLSVRELVYELCEPQWIKEQSGELDLFEFWLRLADEKKDFLLQYEWMNAPLETKIIERRKEYFGEEDVNISSPTDRDKKRRLYMIENILPNIAKIWGKRLGFEISLAIADQDRLRIVGVPEGGFETVKDLLYRYGIQIDSRVAVTVKSGTFFKKINHSYDCCLDVFTLLERVMAQDPEITEEIVLARKVLKAELCAHMSKEEFADFLEEESATLRPYRPRGVCEYRS